VQLIGARNKTMNADGIEGATAVGAHFSNTDADGNWATGTYHAHDVRTPTFADWNMMSLCSAHLEEKHQWGTGIGVEDDLYLTNEEWMKLPDDVDSYVGLAAHAIDIKNQVSERSDEWSDEPQGYCAWRSPLLA